MAKEAIVLLSGGIDSTTTLAIARAEGYDVFALSFDYGQRHRVELERAREIAKAFGAVRHLLIQVNLHEIGGSALTDRAVAVPKDRSEGELASGIPVTYVPARNTIFLAFALAWAEVLEVEEIFFGANVIDYSGYPDCRPEYLRAFEEMARLATRAGVEGRMRFRIRAPLLRMTKAEIIRRGRALGVDYRLTWSCYDPVERSGEILACGRCDSCQLRRRGFAEAGLEDPIRYAS